MADKHGMATRPGSLIRRGAEAFSAAAREALRTRAPAKSAVEMAAPAALKAHEVFESDAELPPETLVGGPVPQISEFFRLLAMENAARNATTVDVVGALTGDARVDGFAPETLEAHNQEVVELVRRLAEVNNAARAETQVDWAELMGAPAGTLARETLVPPSDATTNELQRQLREWFEATRVSPDVPGRGAEVPPELIQINRRGGAREASDVRNNFAGKISEARLDVLEKLHVELAGQRHSLEVAFDGADLMAVANVLRRDTSSAGDVEAVRAAYASMVKTKQLNPAQVAEVSQAMTDILAE